MSFIESVLVAVTVVLAAVLFILGEMLAAVLLPIGVVIALIARDFMQRRRDNAPYRRYLAERDRKQES